MGCFLACFGSSKDRRRRKQSNRRVQVQPRVQRNASFKPVHVQQPVSIEQESAETETIVSSVPESLFKVKPEEQPCSSPKKKVTFDSNVKTYEHVELEEAEDCASETKHGNGIEEVDSGKPSVVKPTQTQSSSEDSSVTSLGSYPPSHRYQNCRESDDECEDFDDDVDDESDGFSDDDDEEEAKPIGSNPSARDRSLYAHSVLNPVENLSQWKAVKAKGGKLALTRPQKENFDTTSDQEPGFNELSLSFKSKLDQTKRSSSSDMAVDTSLSNWLVSPQATTPNNRPNSTFGFNSSTPERITSPRGSNPRSQDLDRPILGALTVEEIRQFSATSSPRKSPSRSPEDSPIIGTVGTYWTHNAPAKTTSGSAFSSSYKGIPNTTSKYREDKKVKWHSTPFETRLERALERSGVAN